MHGATAREPQRLCYVPPAAARSCSPFKPAGHALECGLGHQNAVSVIDEIELRHQPARHEHAVLHYSVGQPRHATRLMDMSVNR